MKTTLLFFTLLTFSLTHAKSEDIESIGFIQLLANPAHFHDKKVRISGYLHCQFEDSGLYFSKEDADYLNGKNAVWIDYSNEIKKQPEKNLEYFDCKYVLIEGIFDKNFQGHLGAFAGTIRDVTRIMEDTRWFDGKKKLKK